MPIEHLKAQTKVANRLVMLCMAVTLVSIFGYSSFQTSRDEEQERRQAHMEAALLEMKKAMHDSAYLSQVQSAQIHEVQKSVNLILKDDAQRMESSKEYRKKVLDALEKSHPGVTKTHKP